RSEGVGPEEVVGILMERSEEMVAGLLGVLKAGGAYLPLDPETPAERVGMMVREAEARIILSQERHRERFVELRERFYSLDVEECGRWSEENPGVKVKADNLAYVIYTSGSTGQPKGAQNTHRAISNRLFWMQDKFHLTTNDHVLQKTPFTFDVSVW